MKVMDFEGLDIFRFYDFHIHLNARLNNRSLQTFLKLCLHSVRYSFHPFNKINSIFSNLVDVKSKITLSEESKQ